MKKEKFVSIGIALIFFALIFLFLRENEGRTAAEEKVKDLEYKIQSLHNDKDNVVMELETQLAGLESKLAQEQEKYEALLDEKSAEIEKINQASQEAALEHQNQIQEKDAEAAQIQSRAKTESEKLNALLSDKNAEIQDLSRRLEEASAKVSSLLKKIQTLEAQNLASQNQIVELESRLKTQQRHNQRLSEIIKTYEQQKSVD